MSLASQITAGFAAVATAINAMKADIRNGYRIDKRMTTEVSSATPTINTDICDIHKISALAVNITSFTTNLTGTPVAGDELHIIIMPTAVRTIAWGAKFESSAQLLPTTTSGYTTGRMDIKFIWNADTAKWRCLGVA